MDALGEGRREEGAGSGEVAAAAALVEAPEVRLAAEAPDEVEVEEGGAVVECSSHVTM